MSNVFELPNAQPVGAILHPRLLKPLSRGLSVLFTILMAVCALWVAGALLVSFIFGNHLLVGANSADLVIGRPPSPGGGMILLSSQPLVTRMAGFVDVVVATAPLLFICWHLRGLFGLYARGTVFARENAAHLKHVGFWLVAYPFTKFAANMLFRLAGGTDTAWFGPTLVYALVLGLIVFVIAQVMAFGHEIEQEKDSFV